MNTLYDREMKSYYVTHVLKQDINIKRRCPNLIHEFRNTNSHLLQVYVSAWAKIKKLSSEMKFVKI